MVGMSELADGAEFELAGQRITLTDEEIQLLHILLHIWKKGKDDAQTSVAGVVVGAQERPEG